MNFIDPRFTHCVGNDTKRFEKCNLRSDSFVQTIDDHVISIGTEKRNTIKRNYERVFP